MINEIVKVVNKLAETTNNGKIKWEKTSKPSEYITYTLPNNAICFSKSSETPEQYSLTILDKTGKEIAKFPSESTDGEAFLAFKSLYSSIILNDEEYKRLFMEIIKKLSE